MTAQRGPSSCLASRVVTTDDRVLTTRAELDELPERSAVRSRVGILAEKGPDGRWYTPPLPEPLPLRSLLAGGVRVLDRGKWPS